MTKISKIISLISIALLFESYALASPMFSSSAIKSASLEKKRIFKFSGKSQFVTYKRSGINLLGELETGLTEDTTISGLLGFGVTDIQVGSLVQWVPFPDYGNQPAMGLAGGFVYAHDRNDEDKRVNILSLRLQPFVSKSFSTQLGLFSPYAILPLSIRTAEGVTDLPLQAIVGSEFKHPELKETSFSMEIGYDLNKSDTYLSFGASVKFNENMEYETN